MNLQSQQLAVLEEIKQGSGRLLCLLVRKGTNFNILA